MSKTIICIVGRTASGKDTFVEYLKAHGLRSVVSHTTRPIRATETEGKEHYFISEEKADEILKDKDNVAAYTVINSYRYFTTVDALLDAHIYVIDPNGIKYLREKHPEISLRIYNIRCKNNEQRALEIRKDNAKTFKDRAMAEADQFDEFESDGHYDKLIWNDGTLDELKAKADKVADRYINDTNETLVDYLMERYPDDYSNIIMFESPNYRTAVIGVSDDMRLIYDYDKMIEHLMKYDGMTDEEAIEFIDYNTVRAMPYYPNGPIISYPIEEL